MKHIATKLLVVCFCGTTTVALCASSNSYVQTNLVSDLPGIAAHQDDQLVNPWGLAAGPATPFWVNDNRMGVATLYNGSGVKAGLVVTIPTPAGGTPPSAPTGMVFNSNSSAFGGAAFIFDTEDGTISAWSGGTSAALKVPPTAGSVYKGLAVGASGTSSMLYAANFGLGRVDVFDSNFNPVNVPGGFQDNTLPSGYAPFNVENIGGKLYVTYALQDADKHDDVSGAGHGFVDVFDTNGHLLQRFASQGSLDSPWGMALATSNFGALSGDLLIGNFGDGMIDAYDPNTGNFISTLDNTNGTPLVIEGLWGLAFGNGAPGQGVDSLFFTAGIPGPDNIEDHGLFGHIDAVPEPQTFVLGALGFLAFLSFANKKKLLFQQRKG